MVGANLLNSLLDNIFKTFFVCFLLFSFFHYSLCFLWFYFALEGFLLAELEEFRLFFSLIFQSFSLVLLFSNFSDGARQI